MSTGYSNQCVEETACKSRGARQLRASLRLASLALMSYRTATVTVNATIATVKTTSTRVRAISVLDERSDAAANASTTVRRSAMSFGEAGSNGFRYIGTLPQLYGSALLRLRGRVVRRRAEAPRLRAVG
jgi:hypothetical protein